MKNAYQISRLWMKEPAESSPFAMTGRDRNYCKCWSPCLLFSSLSTLGGA